VLLLSLGASVVLLLLAGRIALGRDVGSGLLATRDSGSPRMSLLSSPTAFALRSERFSLAVWVLGAGAFAFIVGVISKSISSAGISRSLDTQLKKLGAGSILTPKGYIGFCFIIFMLIVCLFMCAQVGAARHEETEGRLETELAQPVSRRSWLGGRLLLAVAGATVLSLAVGLLTWLGAVSQGVSLSLPTMLGAGLNCLPISVLFLGLAALAYALVPRASTGIAYSLVIVAFLWQLFGSLLGAPKWLVDATPFEHVGLVPAASFRAGDALVMVAIGLIAAICALAAFERRDLSGA
jgi:ABC-2 type transport system permease protein